MNLHAAVKFVRWREEILYRVAWGIWLNGRRARWPERGIVAEADIPGCSPAKTPNGFSKNDFFALLHDLQPVAFANYREADSIGSIWNAWHALPSLPLVDTGQLLEQL